MEHKYTERMKAFESRRKAFILLSGLLLAGGMASAQVFIEGNVYGGGNIGEVTENTSVTVNNGTIGDTLKLRHRVVDQNMQLTTRVDYGNVYGGGNGYKITGHNPNNNAPIFDINAGRVQGNTSVYVGGDAVVRRAVYGGGNMASVGMYSADNGVATYTSGGHTIVTVTGNALIGPKKTDLTSPTPAELDSVKEFYNMTSLMSASQYADSAFKYLGANEGWVFGSSRGISGGLLRDHSFVDTTEVTISGNAQVLNVFGSGENGHVQKGTNVIVKDNALIGGVPLHGAGSYEVLASGITTNPGEYVGATYTLADKDSETAEDEFGMGREIPRGNVLGGGKGTDFISWFANPKFCYTSGRVYGNTHVTVQDNARIYNRVYGGGLISMVGTFTEEESQDPDNHTVIGIASGGHTYVNINGGIIGSPGSNGHNNGEVYGGSRGLPGRPRKPGTGPYGLEPLTPMHQVVDEAYVGHTHVTVDGGTVMNSVYGGGANGHVQGNTYVTIKETDSNKRTIIGLEGVGGWHGNVYAGGGGTDRYTEGNAKKLSITAGRVFGNTNLNITGGTIMHNVYGGGSLASVGTYLKNNAQGVFQAYLGGGVARVNITGGTIGTNGDNNGMVYGSGRGEIMAPDQIMDTLTYMAYTFVNIGSRTVDPETGEASLSGDAKIKGSVYGSGENGHVYLESHVNVYSGTIGCTATEYAAMSEEDKVNKFPYRGNVYGAGCGTDKYDSDNDDVVDTYNPNSGYVWGQTEVNIYGGYISRSVYGAGAMASVGFIDHTRTKKHLYIDHETEPSLSWPYELTYGKITDSLNQAYPSEGALTGKSTVNVFGGHIGTLAAPIAESGNVFGSARGDVGPLGVMDTLAIVRETEVNVNFTPSSDAITDATPNVIIGSVYGSGENGTVYENTKVTLTDGLVAGSVFGGGDGTDTYMVALKDPNNPSSYLDPSPQRSITSGKVYGNTEVVINGGQVLHNVYGGGNLASVGKGCYMGYGEMSDEGIEPTEDPYENSGTCTVTVTGGTIGTTGYPGDGYNNGYVFGSSRGTTFATVDNPEGTALYDYNRDFFLGYVNKTIVNIGDADANVTTGPTVKGSVFGGGDNGHVRWHTNVVVNKGEIGAAYVVPAQYPEADSVMKWTYRGNVYGAGRGADKIGTSDDYCPSAGSVTLNTNVTVNGGTIHRNVYGGGSMATVGPLPTTDYDPGTSTCTVNIFGGAIGEVVSSGAAAGSLYGGNVYGAGRGIIDEHAPLTQFASADSTVVNVDNGSGTVVGNVYGGGSYGQVKKTTSVNMIGGSVEGSVFGGGMGIETEEIAGLVKGNATVDMMGGIVKRSIYGGGQMGSVGTFTAYNDVIYNEGQTNAFTVQVPTACAENTGLATVTMSGGSVGYLGSLMPWEDHNPDDDNRGWIYCGGQGVADSITYPKAIAMGVVGSTYLEIKNTSTESTTIRPLVTASVYGGCEDGLVLNDTHVKIAGGQIGTGHYKSDDVHHFDPMYDENVWDNAIAAVQYGNETDINNAAAGFHECDAWTYAEPYIVYDIYADEPNHPNNDQNNPDYHTADLQGTNGHSNFGNVFGGGSGCYPIAPGVWRRTAGQVNGNTHVEITGGHILTNIYGGNETTDVKGKCTIEMSGGTLGVPRTIEQIQGHPVTCHLFGAGMGDTRTQFNTWTHVGEVEVNITGGTIFGTIFGGGEDGHVLGDVAVNVGQAENKTTLIGIWGRSYVDGNVFGGGRGFSGNALTAGVVMGNVDMTISGGTILGSIYGGGRLASVGTRLVEPNSPQYGQLIPDDEDGTHGHVTINITGGTIGNDYEAIYHTDFNQHTTGGHVFAGAMGRLTKLDNSTNPLWPNLGKVKETVVNISGNNTLIKGNVYGGGEFGTVETDATITVSGGTIMRDVYGGGYGSTDITSIGQLRVPNGSSVTLIDMTPMKLAGRVNGNTKINVNGGWIQKSVFGGGEMATVGVIKNDSVAHRSETTEFALSWPYKMNYEANTGKTEINVTGGRIGITGSDYMGPYAMINGQLTPVQYNDQGTAIPLTETEIDDAKEDNGDVYGGGKGFAAQRYLEAHANNVHDTHISVNYTNSSATPTNYKDKVNGVYSHDCITGAVYGGGENGHVIQNSNITLTNGLVGHSIYGGGKGKGLYKARLNHYTVNPDGSVTIGDEYETDIYSITAGKVYGNTHVTMNGGYVVRNIYGGGNMASVGKGNYTGAPDDYSTTGYGECVTTTAAMADTLNSGNTFVTITGGQLGYLNPSNPDKVIKDGLPYGSVYGGCRGEVQRDVPRTLTPRILYSPEDFLGYVNKTHVVIGSATGEGTGPRIYGSVYGGGQDGHVRWNTNIAFNKGEIGVDFGGSELISNDPAIQDDYNSHHWANRGNVYGAGSGIGQYTDANNEKQYSYISGSVTQFTKVEISGGTIHNNVYGGGNLASVGPPRIFQPNDCPADKTGVTVNITGSAKIGKNTNQNTEYGGKVFGASRGIASNELGNDGKPKYKSFAYCSYTEVNVDDHIVNNQVVASPIIYGAVFGGGENGKVGSYHENSSTHKEDGQNIHTSTVNINGGTIVHGVYGGGQGVYGDTIPGTNTTYVNDTMSGRVMGDATVNLMGGTIGVDNGRYDATVFGGCRRSFVWGNTLVNVGSGTSWNDETQTYDSFDGNLTIFGSIFGANRYNGTPYGNSTVNVFQTAHTAANSYPPIPEELTTDEDILDWLAGLPAGLENFAIKSVYGGSDLIDYIPKAGKEATVNVYQCDKNTIYDVYGGGNAADVGSGSIGYKTNANVNIWGGRMFRVFGGGNGEVVSADIHGKASTTIKGGLIYQVFGGSNNNGIIDEIYLLVDQSTGCAEYIVDVFGGGNSALIIGDVNSTVECCNANYYNYYGGSSYATIYGNVNTNIFGATFVNLFGGSKGTASGPSDIRRFPKDEEELSTYPAEHREALRAYLATHERWGEGGNVTLNIFGGNITNAFGGSDVNGAIDGKIQVNVFNKGGACDLDLINLYGAGQNTPYSPNYAVNEGQPRMTPEINHIHGLVKGCVYGGGKGLTATTTANPVVNIGYYDAMGTNTTGLVGRLVDTVQHYYNTWNPPTDLAKEAKVDVNVFGGGQLADIHGNTTVNVRKANTVIANSLYGGGCGEDGDLDAAMVYGNDTVRIFDGLIKKNVFGGGQLAIVTGSTKVEMSGGTLGSWQIIGDEQYLHGTLYGGGQGPSSLVDTLGNAIEESPDYGRVEGNSYVDISGDAHILKDVYGGGQMGSVGKGILTDNTSGVARVTISGGEIGPYVVEENNANVYGGGQGKVTTYPAFDPTHYITHANVDSTSVIICDSAYIYGNVFGGSANGHVLAGTRVLVEKGSNTVNKTPVIGMTGLHDDGLVFGGGQGTTGSFSAGRVGGSTEVIMTDGTVLGNIYGGGSVALTGVDVNGSFESYESLVDGVHVYDSIHHGLARVEVSGGTIGNHNRSGLDLLLNDHRVGNIYGGGRGDLNEFREDDFGRAANAMVHIYNSPTIYGSVYGGGQMANVGRWNDYDTWYTKCTGTTKVSIEGTPTIGTELEFDYDYSMGTGANAPKWTLYETINGVRMITHTLTGNVYGSGQGNVKLDNGHVVGLEHGHCRTTEVNISGNSTIMGSVFGGSEQGAVWGDTKVDISDDVVIGKDSIVAGNSKYYSYGSVFGGSYGMDAYINLNLTNPSQNVLDSINGLSGRVYGNTFVNITGGAVRCNVFGGGDMASVGEWTEVFDENDNLINIAPKANTGVATVYVADSAIVGPLDGTGLNAYVFGGGKGFGNDPNNLRKKYCNLNTAFVTVELGTNGRVWGSLFGGGNDAHTLGDARVNLLRGVVGTDGTTSWDGDIFGGGHNFLHTNYTAGRVGGNIYVTMEGGILKGNIYGGGRLAMTGIDVNGTMQEGDAHGFTKVVVKGGTVGNVSQMETFTAFSMGNIYGGGKGILEPEEYSSVTAEMSLLLGLTKNTEVIIRDSINNGNLVAKPHIYGIVLGGGEVANVGAYSLTVDGEGNVTNIAVDNGTGISKVNISGGIVGGDRTQMRAETDGQGSPWLKYNDDLGYVYGGGEGISDDPTLYTMVGDTSLLDLMATVRNTEVEISGTAWVKASVFGGSESGHVKGDTKVTIKGGQIGAVYKEGGTADLPPYTDDQFVNPLTTPITEANSLDGTAHWAFAEPYHPFDPVLLSQGIDPTDGRSWFGNVFGGGSGWFPYIENIGTTTQPNFVSHWNPNSGKVWGNTEVIIEGGHILNNVYGANESTDVGGKATIRMSGGTVGVPRTESQIQAQPTTSYVFGGGAGDPRRILNVTTNVDTTDVQITGGIVYGAVYGGGEMGHVVRGASVSIDQAEGKTTIIGTSGFSGHDGHVYGGGKGDETDYDPVPAVPAQGETPAIPSHPNFAPGRVGGNTKVTMSNGTVLGNLYGGGMIARTGVGVDGDFVTFINESVYDSIHHGLTKVEVSGGTIGNHNHDGLDLLLSDQHVGNVFGGGRGSVEEYREDDLGRVGNAVVKISGSPTVYGSVYGGGQMANVGFWNDYDQWYEEGTASTKVTISGTPTIGTQKEFDPVYSSGTGVLTPKWTFYDVINGVKMINHTLTGNVFGGGKGDVKLDEDGYVVGLEHGHCGSSEVSISGTPTIRSSVFGGSERGAVWGDAKVNITGGTIGTVVTGTDQQQSTYNFGSVFGGSYGMDAYTHLNLTNPSQQVLDSVNGLAGRVYGNTSVDITGGVVRGNVFGGGDMASVGEWNNNFVPKDNTGKATVNVSGSAIVGPLDGTGLNASVFGGGKGIGNDPDNLRKKYCNLNSTEVTVSLGENGRVFGSLFGGGSDAHTLGDTHVKLLSGTIGTEGVTSWDGNIFGGGRNFLLLTYAAGRVGGNTSVEMMGGNVLGSVYGGGRNGLTGFSVDVISTGSNTYQALPDNTNDNTYGRTSVKISGGTVGNLAHMKDSEFSIGDVYGGGKGSKTGIEVHPASSALLVSLVKETEVEISGTARIYGNVYGGSELSNVGNFTWKQTESGISNIGYKENTGHTKVTVSGGTIGMDNMQMITDTGYPDDWGHVFGGGQGWVESLSTSPEVDSEHNHLVELMATAVSTEVEISNNAFVLGSVYGGAENGHVTGNTLVKIKGGQIGAGEGIVDAEGHNRPYTDDEWASSTTTLTPTAHWNYVENGLPYDIYILDSETHKPKPGLNGATFYGNVFGGGSGYYPYGVDGEGNSQWLRTAGQVWGNTRVEVTGGHILSCLYGGCETTNIGGYGYDDDIHGEYHISGGQSTIVMTDGTIGVPRTQAQIEALPVPGYLYGSGKGDPRLYFNTWTNVWSSDVAVSGGRIYGSVFGGGEDGHVMGDVNLSISETDPNTPTIIGCGGFTRSDGNVFGSGRGTTTLALTAGSVSGNVNLTVTGGTIHNSVYGGGNRGSVGTYLVDKFVGPEINPHYGQMRPDDGENTYGYTYVTIGSADQQSNIEIGHTAVDEHDLGGNVYGGGRGDAGPPESDFPNMAKVKQTEVNIWQQSDKQTWIEGSVFGSGEDGHVLQDTYVNIHGGQIGGHHYGNLEPCNDPYHGNVYGGGRGVDTYEDPEHPGTFVYSTTAGWVQGNTNVNMYGGHVVRNVYGGGNLASVGVENNNATGLASVTITGGTVGTVHEDENFGNVFGSGHGGSGSEYVHLAYVKNTHVTIGKTARVYGSVFGGGEDGHVRKNAIVDIEGGIIGDAGDVASQPLDGNVYGGGRGLLLNGESQTAGEVYGYTTVNIKNSTYNEINYSPIIWNNVYGGGSQSVVQQYKVVNMSGGLVHGNMFGGSRQVPTGRPNKAPRWVNMWGGTVEGNLYGCSYLGTDGDPALNPDTVYASFINLSGGTIGKLTNGVVSGGDVHAAGYGGEVYGSVAVLIGKNAIIETSTNEGDEFYRKNVHKQNDIVVDNIDIKGSVYGGSYGIAATWDNSFNVSGHSRIYIDGTGYNTTASSPSGLSNYMNIGGGVFGSGTNCESGALSRNILIREYGTRNNNTDGQLQTASRTLTTIQRGDIVLLDHTNVNLKGNADISGFDMNREFAVMQVDKGFYSANASGMVLGATDAPAYMDYIHEVRSLHLKEGAGIGNSYHNMSASSNANWEWIGVDSLPGQANIKRNARLYYTQTAPNTALQYNQENVIIFRDDSRLYVRYLDKANGNKRMYGQLQGFFRMLSPFSPYGKESFAYARPKVTPKNNPIKINEFDYSVDTRNEGDGGFLSYDTINNFFTEKGHTVLYYTYPAEGNEGGIAFTKTKQYPYFNIGEFVMQKNGSEMDMEEYREWVLPRIDGEIWYVDGRGVGNGGWGKDKNHQDGWGHFPDMPKLTVTAEDTIGQQNGEFIIDKGVCYDNTPGTYYPFIKGKDIIYVVGPIEAILEKENLNRWPDYQLKLYRYPGGHEMSNGKIDATVVYAGHPAPVPTASYDGLKNEGEGSTMNPVLGPGANLGMMIHSNKTDRKFVMNNVLVDGLFTYEQDEINVHNIPESYQDSVKYKVSEPMVVTVANDSLILKGNKKTDTSTGEIVANGTIIHRGYNGTDAANTWYYDADYVTQGDVHHGGGLFVDNGATVIVDSLVTITDNVQRKGSGTGTVRSNVFLPTFSKSLSIADTLVKDSRIGITSPIRNAEPNYLQNTLSPIAVAPKYSVAKAAWINLNFFDDLDWFFVNKHSTTDQRSSYFFDEEVSSKTLYFGWTWANVVRSEPSGYVVDGETGNVTISTKEGLAWLISKVNGLNDQTPNVFSGKTISQIDDFDLQQYVWVPIGTEKIGDKPVQPFSGKFDGRGHLIENLEIHFVGMGDLRYERSNYGLFGLVDNGTINRTFVVSGNIEPVDMANIGGLVGTLQGPTALVSNSEAAVKIEYTQIDHADPLYAGGLVGQMIGGDIHSSMAMPYITAKKYPAVGGLVGLTKATLGDNPKTPSVKNSFANVKFNLTANSSCVAGGLVGYSEKLSMSNCYSHIYAPMSLTTANYALLVAKHDGDGSTSVEYCFGDDVNYSFVKPAIDTTMKHLSVYTPTMGADSLGYMYSDNRVFVGSDADTTLVAQLNINALRMNREVNDSVYSYWARPGIREINEDRPVLLLGEFDDKANKFQGGFRTVATYGGRPSETQMPVLQYGGPVRDGEGAALNEIDAALVRDTTGNSLFIYGDITVAPTVPVAGDKLSVYEHASILHPGTLKDFDETYVGISFDNSCGHAVSTPEVNYMGSSLLPRDWHMFSTPLSNAPLGFDYRLPGTETNTNISSYAGGDYDNEKYYNNIWVNRDTEFSWLTQPGSPECNPDAGKRYWMDPAKDGYFPVHRGSLFNDNLKDLFIVGSDECPSLDAQGKPMNRYPYGMDFYTWTEPQYHWLNFKRNGPNHWHTDENAQLQHEHLEYVPVAGATPDRNEDILIPARGYLGSITVPTFMQSHGTLNNGNVSIALTEEGKNLTGWNLVGNPFHGYLDFAKFVQNENNAGLLAKRDGNPFYVVYDADEYEGSGFLYYPDSGSENGEYAGRYIHPHQGFYVKLVGGNTVANPALQFSEDMVVPRSEVKESHFRDEEQPAYPLVNLYLSSDNGCADVTVIEFERPEWGGARKLKELRVGNGVFYAQHDETHYAALFAKVGTERVPLWFEAKEDDVFTIKWNTANGNFHSMYLVDNIMGIRYDMLRNDTYTFEGHKGDYPSRFYITFNVTDVEEHIENCFVFFDGSQWVVTGDGELDFIDPLGQVLARNRVSGQTRLSLPEVACGVYLFRLTNGHETKVQKVIVKR